MNSKKVIWFLCLFGVLLCGSANASDKVYICNWTEYIPDEVLEKFPEETDIKVIYTT